MYTTSLQNKIWLGISYGLVAGVVFRRLTFKYFSPWIPPILLLAIAIIILLSGIIIPFVWHSREKKGTTDNNTKAKLEHILIYALALDLTMFGWHKIEGLQMIVPLGILDTPFSSLSGETLVWAFFKYSYPFTVFLALLQIGTALLLLFSKTRLFGLILTVPILVFISSIDFFYSMPVGVLVHGLILLMGVCYLLSQNYKSLIAYIFLPMQGLNHLNMRTMTKILLKISMIIAPLFFSLIYNYPNKHPELTGKYSVDKLTINDIGSKATSPKDSVLTTVYMDLEDEIAFDFNDYRYRYIGTYYFNNKNGSITIKWRYPSDKLAPFKGKLTHKKNTLTLNGKMNGEKLEMELRKEMPNH